MVKTKIQRLGAAQESLPSDSGTETEQQSEEENKEQDKTPPLPLNQRACLKPVLNRHSIQECSERGRRLIRYVEEKQPKNPGGYLESTLQKSPMFDPGSDEELSKPPSGYSGGPVPAGDILQRMGYGK